MMDHKKWAMLFNAFKEEEPWWEGKYADESNFEGMNLMEWLDCDSRSPSYETMRSFGFHGYEVFPVEKDSFGWLIGGVRRMLDPSGKVITFG